MIGGSDRIQRNFAAMTDSGSIHFAPAASAVLDDVTVIGNGLAAIGDTLLSESLNCVKNLRTAVNLYRPTDGVWVTARPSARLERVPAIAGRRHVLLKQSWDTNFGHWLIDAFPKLGLLPDLHDPSECLIVVNRQPSEGMRRVVLDSLELAGYDESQVHFLDARPRTFERLTVLGTITDHPTRKSSFAIRFLEEIADQVEPAEEVERIYLSRNNYSRRRIVNEDEVIGLLGEHGYRALHTEQLSLREQIAIFKSASHVVGNMGANMANLAFSPAGVSVLSLATEWMNHDYFYDIVCHKKGRYRGLQGAAVDERPDLASDFVVDLDRLSEGLVWLHS